MRLKDIQIKEDGTPGCTASGNIASIANPHVTNLSRNSVAYTGKPGGPGGKGPVKQVKGGTYNTGKNALDMDVKLLSTKFNMQDMVRYEALTEDLIHTKVGWIYHFNTWPRPNPAYWMEKTYRSLYGN